MSNPTTSKPLPKSLFDWLKKGWQQLRTYFSKPSDAPNLESGKPGDGQSGERGEQQIEDLTKHFAFEPNVFPEMSDDLRMQIKNTMNSSWNLGYADGSIGQRQMSQDFFRAQADQVRDQFLYFLKGKSIPALTQAAELQARFDKTSDALEQAQNYRSDALTRRQLYPRQYSWALAVIYIFVAGMLLLADIPLALMVTQLIFNLPAPDEFHDLGHLFFRLADDPCSNILVHIAHVAAGNWQVTVMTAGVSLCAIYFKIFYDDFMGYSADKTVRQFRLLSLNHRAKKADGDDGNHEKEERQIRWLYALRLTGKFAILVFTIWTIVHLGNVRAVAEEWEDNLKYQTTEQPKTPTGWQPGAADLPTAELPTDAKSVAIKERLNGLKSTMFILLTILLPLIAGICFSLGMGNFHNRKESGYAEKLFNRKIDEHAAALKLHKEAQMHASTYESFITRCDEPGFVSNYEISFYHCYLHGYQRGVVNPDRNLDMYERAKKFRDRLLATKSSEAIQRANSKIPPVNPITHN